MTYCRRMQRTSADFLGPPRWIAAPLRRNSPKTGYGEDILRATLGGYATPKQTPPEMGYVASSICPSKTWKIWRRGMEIDERRCAKVRHWGFYSCPEIITAAEVPGELAPITLPEAYLKDAGARARQRVGQAGMRLAAVLRQK
jgi:hypothetical protein